MKNKIECPNCHTAFTIDEAGYADIVRQVHGAEFEKALDDRLQAAEGEGSISTMMYHQCRARVTNTRTP